jgi:GTP-binding protein
LGAVDSVNTSPGVNVVAPAVILGLEECLEHINHDEYVKVTPGHVRMRKAELDEIARRKAQRRGLSGDD